MTKHKKSFSALLVIMLAAALIALAISAVALDGKEELRAQMAAQRASLTTTAARSADQQPAVKAAQPNWPSLSAMAPVNEEIQAALAAKAAEQSALEAKLAEQAGRMKLSPDLSQTKASRPHVEKDLRANPFKTRPTMPAHTHPTGLGRTEFLWEGFESGSVPPPGWTAIVNNPYTWEIDSYDPFEGTYNASCFYDQDYTGTQDEWLISPTLDLTGAGSDLKLEFAWLSSYYWGVDPYDNYDLVVEITTDDGATWDTLWCEDSVGVFTSWTWYEATVSLSAYSTKSNVKLGFRYYGYDGAQGSIDAISVNDIAAPVGRCCYGDPTEPSCADVTELECDAMDGYSWDEGLNCTDNPCPIAPDNDECANAELINPPFPATASGTTEGATIDCPGVLDWNSVWYKFDAPYECNNVVIDYCGSPYEIQCIGVILYAACDDCPNYILYNSIEWLDCEGLTQPKIHWNSLPGPATYYIPVFIGDAGCNGIESPFQFTLDVTECPPRQPGDWCLDPIKVDPLTVPWDDLNQTTCGRGHDYDGVTCLGYYDTGEDIIYEITVSSEVLIDITLDPKSTTYTGFALGTDCPPTNCLAMSTNYSASPHGVSCVSLDPGVYYLMVDTWTSPDCISDFDLHITAAEDCENNDFCAYATPIGEVTDMPFTTVGASFDGPGGCMTSPNIWFCYTAGETGTATVSLCGSSYDTKLAAYDGCECWGPQIACNDDYCGLQSQIEIPVTAGNQYLIEVGGYSSNTGDGILNIWVSPPCVVECPSGATDEGEDCLTDDAVDVINGGCNSTPNVFSSISCGETVCGETSTYLYTGYQYRDTDWYELTLDEWSSVTWTVEAEFDVLIFLIDGNAGCAGATILASATAGDCEVVSVSGILGPGTYWLWVGPSVFTGYPCASGPWDYVGTVTCEPITSGACCYEDGSCVPDMEEADCYNSGGADWFGGVSCDPDPCPCYYNCPPGATPEGEECLVDEDIDDTNGGCNSVPNVFGSISCGETICGEWSTYLFTGLNYRDTDWYELVLDDYYTVTLNAEGGFPIVFGFIEQIVPGVPGCGNITGYISPYAVANPCTPASVQATLGPGTYYVFVGGQVYSGYPCAAGPWQYEITATCAPVVPTYCEASGLYSDEYIAQVQVGTIDNSSGWSGYADYTAMSTDMAPETGYPITITIGGGYSSDTGAVYVDWNQDLDFNDPGELQPLDVGLGYGPYTGTITPPAGALGGETRMRIRLAYSTAPVPCGDLSWGEVEDYTVNVVVGPECCHLFEPDPVLVLYKYAINPMDGVIYLDAGALGGDPHDVTNVSLKVGGCSVCDPCTFQVIEGGYGDLTGDVLKVTFNLGAYIACEEADGLVWDDIDSFFDVFFDLGGSPGSYHGSVEMIGHTPGDVNLDGRVNVADLTFLVNYLFKGGTAPRVLELADVNGSGSVNVADVTYLVNYLFRSGPAPIHP
jgi:hypothetical protein